MNFPHWDYLLAIDRDLDVTSRYIDFADANMGVYSTELTRMYLAVCSEVDVAAKQLTTKIDPNARTWDINDYRKVISVKYSHFCVPCSCSTVEFVANTVEGLECREKSAMVEVV